MRHRLIIDIAEEERAVKSILEAVMRNWSTTSEDEPDNIGYLQ
jgi:hypothetical protein